jgi:hypothetical protein
MALLRRGYYLFVSTGHVIGTVVLVWAWRRVPAFKSRAWQIAWAFAAVNTLAVCVLGGAVLERYLLPVLPVVYTAFAVAIRALLPRPRRWVPAALILCLTVANFVNPPYPFPFENNLSFASFVELEQQAAAEVDLHPGIVATTFPMADALRRPEMGYVGAKRRVIEMKSFKAAEVAKLNARRPDVMVVYDTAWDPWHILSSGPSEWLMRKFYGYEPPLSPAQAAAALGMHVDREWNYRGMKMALVVRDGAPAQAGR